MGFRDDPQLLHIGVLFFVNSDAPIQARCDDVARVLAVHYCRDSSRVNVAAAHSRTCRHIEDKKLPPTGADIKLPLKRVVCADRCDLVRARVNDCHSLTSGVEVKYLDIFILGSDNCLRLAVVEREDERQVRLLNSAGHKELDFAAAAADDRLWPDTTPSDG